jgi:predicted DNA-binding mobile mystery protein A
MNAKQIILKQLDEQLMSVRNLKAFQLPRYGWARTIRKSLGMTIKQLSSRLSVDPSRVVKIETSEINGTVTLKTLKEVAEKLECNFVYSFVPKNSLQETINKRADNIATMQIKSISRHMDLEAQSVDKNWLKDQKERLINELLDKSWKHLWSKEDV